MTRFVGAIVIAILAARASVAQHKGPEREEVRQYDVGKLAHALATIPTDSSFMRSPIRRAEAPTEPQRALDSAEPDIESLKVASLVRSILLADPKAGPRTEVSAGRGRLSVRGTTSVHELVDRALTEIVRQCSREIEVEIFSLSSGMLEAAPSAVLTQFEAERLLRTARPMLTATVHPWTETPLSATSPRAYVGEHRATEGSWYPKLDEYEAVNDVIEIGARATIVVEPIPGDRFLVKVLGRQTSLDLMRSFPLLGKSDLVVELPHASWAATCACGSIEPGGALIMGTDSIKGAAWAVRIVAPPLPRVARDRSVVPSTRIAGDLPRGLAYEVRAGTMDPTLGSRAVCDDLDALAGRLDTRAITLGISGDLVGLVVGRSNAFVSDFECEVSNAAWIAAPVIDELFTGLSMTCTAIVRDPGRCQVDASLDFKDLISIKAFGSRVQWGYGGDANCEIPSVATSNATISTDLSLGSWSVLHAASVEGTGRQLVVMMRVREL